MTQIEKIIMTQSAAFRPFSGKNGRNGIHLNLQSLLRMSFSSSVVESYCT